MPSKEVINYVKNFLALCQILVCFSEGSTTTTKATSVGCGVTREGNRIFCDFAVTAEAAQCEIQLLPA